LRRVLSDVESRQILQTGLIPIAPTLLPQSPARLFFPADQRERRTELAGDTPPSFRFHEGDGKGAAPPQAVVVVIEELFERVIGARCETDRPVRFR
jgi:hypothetical protein